MEKIKRGNKYLTLNDTWETEAEIEANDSGYRYATQADKDQGAFEAGGIWEDCELEAEL